jgi:Uma2 family endonuclease
MNIAFRPPISTIAELLHHLGDIPAERVRFNPIPGTATIDDLLSEGNDRCELVDGTLVEKPVGQEESFLGYWLGTVINNHVLAHNLGFILGEAGFVELPDGPVRGPDVAFYSWGQRPGRRRPQEPIPRMAPDLAVEVLSPSNTTREMARKRGEYFRSGTRLVWEIDPKARTVRVYTAEDMFRDLTPTDALDGASVLPGLTIPVADLFAELDRHG